MDGRRGCEEDTDDALTAKIETPLLELLNSSRGERAGLRGKECFDRKSFADVFAHGCGEEGEPISEGDGALYFLRFGSRRPPTSAFPKIEIFSVLPHPGTK